MLRHKAFKFRLYPNPEQAVQMRRTLGCCRLVWNHFLAKWNETYETTGKGLSYQACATALPALKQELPWLKDVDSIALQSAVRHLAEGFQRFFKQQNATPRFKSRKQPTQSYTTRHTNGNIAVRGNTLQLPKLGAVRFAKSREVEGRLLSATIRLAPSGKWFISLICEVDIQPLPAGGQAIGIDVGLKHLAVASDGEAIANPRHTRRYGQQLAKWQRRMSRRTRGGSNWQRARSKVARIHEKIRNSRRDVLHKQTTKWIRENQTICLEGLRIVEMMAKGKLAKEIADAAWGEMRRQLQYKAEWYGRQIKEVPAFVPTSQTCHVCGAIHPEVRDLSVRAWECPLCHTWHDRDLNAAKNIKVMAV